jgi:hypothetical protein
MGHYRCRWQVGALFRQSCECWFVLSEQAALGQAHHATVLPMYAAACGHASVVIRSKRQERRDDREETESQQQNGNEFPHSSPVEHIPRSISVRRRAEVLS